MKTVDEFLAELDREVNAVLFSESEIEGARREQAEAALIHHLQAASRSLASAVELLTQHSESEE